jgi:CRP-like cAMP-binding protein
LFQFCPPEDIAKFAECTRIRRYAPGELICARGTTGSEFYIVMEGAVDIAVPKISEASVEGAGAGASEVRVRQVPAGGFFGEIACLEENGTRTANARSSVGCVLLLVPKSDFLRMVETHPRAAMGLVRHLANTVRHNTDSMARLVPPEEYDHGAETHPTEWQKFAGAAAHWAAHWSFAALNLGLWILWLAADRHQLMQDLHTMNGLNLWVGLQAIVMTIFVLASQKRSEEKEQRRRDLQFQWASATMERINQIHERLVQFQEKTGEVSPREPNPKSRR